MKCHTPGGLDESVSYSAQHLTLTSQSSLYAMIATAVAQYMSKGTIDERLRLCFKSIRVTLLFGATESDINFLNDDDNISRETYKVHWIGDDWQSVNAWKEAMLAMGWTSDKISALEIFKFALIVGDPRNKAPDWLLEDLRKKGEAPTYANKLKVVKDKASRPVKLFPASSASASSSQSAAIDPTHAASARAKGRTS